MKNFTEDQIAEIVRDYKEAKDPFKQVGILADLNQVSRKEMAQLLAAQGCEVDGRYLAINNAKRKKPEAPKKPDQKAKADAGKPRLSLVPPEIIFDIARIREYGNAKYGATDNWKTVEVERYRDAAFRHLLAYISDPQGKDEESGLPHLWHLACNVAFLCAMEDGHDKR